MCEMCEMGGLFVFAPRHRHASDPHVRPFDERELRATTSKTAYTYRRQPFG